MVEAAVTQLVAPVARGRRCDLLTVQQRQVQVGSRAANAHAHTFTVSLVFFHLNAGNTLQGIGNIDIRELTNVFR